jgi:aromatic ring-cleaving dioxygenase
MNFLEPFDYMLQGIDIHCLFEIEDIEEAKKVYQAFLSYLDSNNILYQHHRVFDRPVGPWPTPMWQIVIRPSGESREDFEIFAHAIGKAYLWLMLNRDKFSVMIHPNTGPRTDKQSNELLDHTQYVAWLGKAYDLNLSIFKRSFLPS